MGTASVSSYFSARLNSITHSITDTTPTNTKVPMEVSKLNRSSTNGAALDA